MVFGCLVAVIVTGAISTYCVESWSKFHAQKVKSEKVKRGQDLVNNLLEFSIFAFVHLN